MYKLLLNLKISFFFEEYTSYPEKLVGGMQRGGTVYKRLHLVFFLYIYDSFLSNN